MKRLICVVLGLLLLCACTAPAQVPQLMEPVRVTSDIAVASIGNIYNGSVIEGYLVPELEELSFSSGGRVAEVCVTMGARVKAGDPIVKLDTSLLQTQRDALADQLEYARTMDDFSTREVALTLRTLELQYGADSGRCKLYTNEQAEAEGKRKDEIAQLEEQLAELDEVLNVDSVLIAPFDGTVVSLNAKVGNMVFADAVIATVANDKTCYLRTEYMSQSTIDQTSEIYASIGGVRYEVTYVPMDPNEYVTKSLSGETLYSTFEVGNASGELIGQYAMLYMMTAQQEQVLNVPANAVLRDAAGYYVYVDENGEKMRRDVEVGLVTVAQVEILSGLKEGERVYVVG